jgi:chorismate synthase
MNTIGHNLKMTFSGESHSDFLMLEIEGLPAGIHLDEALIRSELTKRRPKGDLTTSRIERDDYEIVSGVSNNLTSGGKLIFKVQNTAFRPLDYAKYIKTPRPGHADFPASVKFPGYDSTGGGMFSGRLTVLFSIAGAIAKQLLNAKNIYVGSHISLIGAVKDHHFEKDKIALEVVKRLEKADFPLLDESKEADMKEVVLSAKANSDSIGGIVESCVVGMPVGLGEPLFDSVESTISHILFSIPAVKGVEFGDGFSFAKSLGSAVSDGYKFSEDGHVVTISNHNGGILGGMSTGMPIIIRTAIKPTSSIGLPQKSVNLDTREPVELVVNGRHDPCIVLRAVHVVNSVIYCAILDLLMYPGPWNQVK